MFFGTIFIVGLLLVGLVLAGVLIGIFNKLVTYANRYKNAFAQIDVQLKRRYDLIPNLVETAKGYMAHERETLRGRHQRQKPGLGWAQGRRSRSGQCGSDPESSWC